LGDGAFIEGAWPILRYALEGLREVGVLEQLVTALAAQVLPCTAKQQKGMIIRELLPEALWHRDASSSHPDGGFEQVPPREPAMCLMGHMQHGNHAWDANSAPTDHRRREGYGSPARQKEAARIRGLRRNLASIIEGKPAISSLPVKQKATPSDPGFWSLYEG
jgi:hypothetical protein